MNHQLDALDAQIAAFLEQPAFGVAGASTNREKYGNKVLRTYLQKGRTAYPINPRADEVEGLKAYASVADLPEDAKALSIITPPPITRQVVKAALERGITQFWIQPGAEDDEAIKMAQDAGANVIHGGTCLLVVLGFRA